MKQSIWIFWLVHYINKRRDPFSLFNRWGWPCILFWCFKALSEIIFIDQYDWIGHISCPIHSSFCSENILHSQMYWYVPLYLKAEIRVAINILNIYFFSNYVGDLILPNWRPMKISDICSDENKTVGEVLGHLRIPPTLRVQIRYAVWNSIRMVYLYNRKCTTIFNNFFYFSKTAQVMLMLYKIAPNLL